MFSPRSSLKNDLFRCLSCSSESRVFTSSLSIEAPPAFPSLGEGSASSVPLLMLACQRSLGTIPRERWRIEGHGMEGQEDEEVTGLLVSDRRLVNGAEWADEGLGFTLSTNILICQDSRQYRCALVSIPPRRFHDLSRLLTVLPTSEHLKRTAARSRRCLGAPQVMNLLHSRAVSTRCRRCAMREIHAIAGGTY